MLLKKIGSFWVQCVRVFKITKKPGKQEYSMIVKMSGLGITIIGVLGFLITYAREILF